MSRQHELERLLQQLREEHDSARREYELIRARLRRFINIVDLAESATTAETREELYERLDDLRLALIGYRSREGA